MNIVIIIFSLLLSYAKLDSDLDNDYMIIKANLTNRYKNVTILLEETKFDMTRVFLFSHTIFQRKMCKGLSYQPKFVLQILQKLWINAIKTAKTLTILPFLAPYPTQLKSSNIWNMPLANLVLFFLFTMGLTSLIMTLMFILYFYGFYKKKAIYIWSA